MDDRIRRFWCARGQIRRTVVVVVDYYTVQQTTPSLFSGAMGSTLRLTILTDNFCTFFFQVGLGQNKTANFSLPNFVAKLEFCYTDCRRNLHMILMDCVR